MQTTRVAAAAALSDCELSRTGIAASAAAADCSAANNRPYFRTRLKQPYEKAVADLLRILRIAFQLLLQQPIL